MGLLGNGGAGKPWCPGWLPSAWAGPSAGERVVRPPSSCPDCWSLCVVLGLELQTQQSKPQDTSCLPALKVSDIEPTIPLTHLEVALAGQREARSCFCVHAGTLGPSQPRPGGGGQLRGEPERVAVLGVGLWGGGDAPCRLLPVSPTLPLVGKWGHVPEEPTRGLCHSGHGIALMLRSTLASALS